MADPVDDQLTHTHQGSEPIGFVAQNSVSNDTFITLSPISEQVSNVQSQCVATTAGTGTGSTMEEIPTAEESDDLSHTGSVIFKEKSLICAKIQI